jgi:DNA primase
MDILILLQQDGIEPKRVSSTNGGEYHGPCPLCSGTDRFIVNPLLNPEKGGHFYCRQCKFSGDAITYLIKIRGMRYPDACIELNITPDFQYNPKPALPKQTTPPWEPRTVAEVSPAWSTKAEAVLFEAYKNLLSSTGKVHREYLSQRGISIQTIKQARIGLISSSLTFERQTWGLSLPEKKDALNRLVWIPEGILIPMFHNSKVVRLRIRQDNPKNSDRYILVAGSATAYLQHNQEINLSNPSIIFESELDGWLIHQIAGDQLNIFSAGNSTTRPDLETHLKIKQTSILISLDNDAAGQKEAQWWRKQYPDSLVWPSIKKDPGDDFKAGIDLKKWVNDGINKLKPMQKSEPQAILSEPIKQQPIQQPTIRPKQPKLKQSEQPEYFTCFNFKCAHLRVEQTKIFDFRYCGLFQQPNPDPENKLSIFHMDACPEGRWMKKDS